jgi:8-oxo-dGTP pyrophosphatase MutT (NUDIX family)
MIAHPHVRGVKCVLTDGERVLLVRHTYGHREWDFPGGKLHRDEEPAHGAGREMHEELGVAVERWTSLGVLRARLDGRTDEMHLFTADVAGQRLTVDACELAEVRWFERGRLPHPVRRTVAEIMARAA